MLRATVDEQSITISVFTKDGGPLTKHISLDDDGQLKSDGSECRMAKGSVRLAHLTSMDALAALLGSLQQNEAIALGTVQTDRLSQAGTASVLCARDLPLDASQGLIARTLDHMSFRAGTPALLLVDYDSKGLADDLRLQIREVGFSGVLAEVIPALANTSSLWRPSTSSGIFNSQTGQQFEKDGGHLYVAVQDAADIGRAIHVLHQRCWLAGFGHILVGRAGQLLERSIVDVAVGSPERLVFEAAPRIDPPLAQGGRSCIINQGGLLDTRVAIPDLTSDEQDTFDRLLAIARAKANEIAAPIRKKVDDQELRKLRAHGVPETEARKRVAANHSGQLYPHVMLEFDDLGTATVSDVLTNPHTYHGETLADPLEPDTGRCRAKLFVNSNGSVLVHTFARGGAVFRLLADRNTIDHAIQHGEPSDVMATVTRLIASADLTPTELDGLVAPAALRSGTGKGAVRKEIAAAAKASKRPVARLGDLPGRLANARPILMAPPRDGEFSPTLHAVDAILSNVDEIEPPFRLATGELALIREAVPSGLHMLLSDDERSQEEDGEESFIAAPPHLTLMAADYTGLALLVEKYIQFEHQPKDGEPYFVRIREAHGIAYSQWPDSKLPRVHALVTLPMVLLGRKLFAGRGLDRDQRVIFRIPGPLLDCMPAPDEVTLDYAVDRFDWLVNEWLVDVSADMSGKAAIIAMAAQTIQRHILPERPAFVVDAGLRGGGKTTVVIMVSIAVTGSRPAAAAWTDKEDERRKALMAALMTGVPMIPFDNIGRGTHIQCPHIEAALTSAEKTDRVLQESRVMTVFTTSTIVFTGNNIMAAGDMASRTLRITLGVDRPDPENREFVHSDPAAWTLKHRGEILNAIYSILLVPRDGKEASNPKTRFKTWQRLIGCPIEIVANEWLRRKSASPEPQAAPFSFQDMLRGNEDDDPEAEGTRELLETLWNDFSDGAADRSRPFKAGAVAAILQGPGKYDQEAGDWEGWRAEKQKADELRGSLAAALGSPPLHGRLTPNEIGSKLRALAGRPVVTDDSVMTLCREAPHQRTKKKGSANFWLERRAQA
jgi:hypothetical protein